MVTCYDAKSGGLASKLIEDSYRAFDANEHFPPNVSVASTAPALSDSEHVCPWPRNFIRVFLFQGYTYPTKE